jgi:hypothetical protein
MRAMQLTALLSLALLGPGTQAQTSPPPSAPLAAAQAITPHSSNAAPVASMAGARIQFATPEYDFGRIQAGQVFKYNFMFTNTGNQTLEIKEVTPSCGCTTTGPWQHKVEPGQTGAIPIQFNSGGTDGSARKTILVACNAIDQPMVLLELKGTVWKPIEVNPMQLLFNMIPGAETNDTRIVHIVNNMEAPLNLSAPEVNNPAIAADLKPVRSGKEFELRVKMLATPAVGAHLGKIVIKTSSTNMPIITISAVVVVQQPISVAPPQLLLPAGPLVSAKSLTITIRNLAQAPISVSELAFSEPGIIPLLQEDETGRVFKVTLTFPPGFEVPAGRKAELSFKTSHPQPQKMKIPVLQLPRPAVVPSMQSVATAVTSSDGSR